MCVGSSCFRICHWGPIVALVIIKWISLATVYSNAMWWPPGSGWGGWANMMGFIALSSLTTFHFFCTMWNGPGYLPYRWQPEKELDREYLQYCEACQGFKAPRAHHCRKCGRCVMKMDHHCPWINNCIGHLNHGHFIGFLMFSVMGSAHATYALSMTLYHGLNRSWYHYYGTGREPKVNLSIWSLLVVMFAFGLAVGVLLAVGALLYFQLRSVWRNQTGIEDWIIEKANFRQHRKEAAGAEETLFSNPYNLGIRANLGQVLGRPSCTPVGDGITWKVREGADVYALTIEQLQQKEEKRCRTREYKIVMPYSGYRFPVWSFGFRTGCRPPCADEPTIRLRRGDAVRVTRWKKRWLYGEKVRFEAAASGDATPVRKKRPVAASRCRGWFPRMCAVEVVMNGAELLRWSQQDDDKMRSDKRSKKNR